MIPSLTDALNHFRVTQIPTQNYILDSLGVSMPYKIEVLAFQSLFMDSKCIEKR